MAIVPIVAIDQALYPITRELHQIETTLNRYRVIIGTIDTHLREILSLASEVATCQLEIINELSRIHPQEKTVQKIEGRLDEKLSAVR